MIKKVIYLGYGIFCYGVFFLTFLYAIGFIGNFGVPVTLDGDVRGRLWSNIAIDLGLLALFAAQHSIMARHWFKRWWVQFVPQPLERSTYVLFSSVALILLFWLWRPLGGIVWSVENQLAQYVLWGLFASGWLIILITTFLINHFDLFGLRQVWLYFSGKPYEPLKFTTPGLYRLVRHPLYVGWLLVFWMTPHMTFAHLLFAVATTVYILVAIRFEERDLVQEFGDAYEDYRRAVPMIVPFTGKGK